MFVFLSRGYYQIMKKVHSHKWVGLIKKLIIITHLLWAYNINYSRHVSHVSDEKNEYLSPHTACPNKHCAWRNCQLSQKLVRFASQFYSILKSVVLSKIGEKFKKIHCYKLEISLILLDYVILLLHN